MESWPLIKKNATLTCGDVSHVMRETFRDYYTENIIYTEHSSNLINVSKLNNPDLQKCANEVQKTFQQHELYIQDIQDVEQKIFNETADCIKRENFINTNVAANSNMKLRRHPVFKDLDPKLVEKYNLIQSDDLLPPQIERLTSFTLDSDLRNHYKKHLESNSYGSLIYCHYHENNVLSKKPYEICSKNPKTLRCSDSKLNQERLSVTSDEWTNVASSRSKLSKEAIPEKLPIRLRAEPENVLFFDYSINVGYEQVVKIRNVAGSVTRFTVPIFNDHLKFKIIWKHLTTSLTSGMYATFVVRFFTSTYDDTTTHLHFRVKDGQDLIIQLTSKRITPLLTGILYSGASSFQLYQTLTGLSPQINKVLNSTIECKSCLIGTTNKIILNFCKYGADASYFLISEYSWYNMIVNEITTSLEIKLPPFNIYPAYFTIKSNEIIDIQIEYSPQEFGLHLNKLIVICDNCTYDYLDLVGDGLYFQPDYIQLQALDKSYSIVYDSDYESKYVLDLGTVLTFRSSQQFDIYVTNRSVLKFDYRWELRRPEFKLNPNTTLLCMNPNWIKLLPLKGRLNRETDTKFTISAVGNTGKGGCYRYVIELYITDIPVSALADNHTFTVVDSKGDEDSNLVDILIGEIELWLKIDEASIFIDPYIIHIQADNIDNKEQTIKKVQVLNLCHHSLNCVWYNKYKSHDTNISMFPEKFVLEANKVQKCKLTVNLQLTEDIKEEYVCQVNGINVKMSLYIHVTLTIPVIQSSTHVLNFGFVKYASNIAKAFRITNKSIVPLKWFITEYIYDHKTKRMRKAVNTYLNKQTGSLIYKEEGCDLEYSLYTGNIGKWCSILIITTAVSCEIKGTDFVIVFGEILRPVLGIYAPKMATATLSVPISYINLKQFYCLQLRNHSQVSLSYAWGRPEGSDLDKVVFSIWPMDGSLHAMTCTKLYIVLDPQKVGQVTDFHVPCFVGNNIERLWLSVEIKIEDISVRIYDKYKINPYSFVQWPPILEEDNIRSITLPESSTSTTGASTTGTLSESMESLWDTNSEKSVMYYDAGGINIDHKFTRTLSEEASEIWSEDFPSGMTYTTYSSRDSFLTLHSLSQESKPQYYNKFQHNCNSHYQMDISFRNVGIRKPVKKTILIKNITPIRARYWIKAKNFPITDIRIPIHYIDRIQAKLSDKQQEHWSRCLNEVSVGFLVYIDPVNGILKANDYSLFEIWIYGDTWGVYNDEITIHIEGQKPFNIHLLVEIVGQPIIFPILCNNQPYPIVRFGTMAYESESLTRKVKVKNASSISVTVVWHVFLQMNDGHRKDGVCMSTNSKDFNLVLDLFNLSKIECDGDCECIKKKTNLELMLTPFFGNEDLFIFTISPTEMRIKPQATNILEITFNPKEFHPAWGELKIEAFIIGHVKVSQSESTRKGKFKRLPLYNTHPTKIKLEAALVLPLSKLEVLRGDIKFKVFAATVISKKKSINVRRTFLFRNNNNVPINAKLYVKPPFKILEVKTKNIDEKSTENKIMKVHIESGLSAEILLECHFNKQFVQEVSDNISLTDEHSHYSIINKTVTIPHQLIIEQPDLLTQTVPLEIVIVYPEISISTLDLDFGPVTIGCVKKLIISLTNRTCSNIDFTISRKSQFQNFTMAPLTGVLPKVLAGRCFPFDICVLFKPTEIKRYMDTIIICTGISTYFQEISIEGRGTLNLRFSGDDAD